MKEIELIHKRRPREKHYLREDGTIIAKIYDTDIHYQKNGRYEEIDNTLIKEKDCYVNKSNDYKVFFKECSKDSLIKIVKDNNYLDMKLKESNNVKFNKKIKLNKFVEDVYYNNILNNIDIDYKTLPTKIKETIILKNNPIEKLTFVIYTNLTLKEENGTILAIDNHQTVFTIDKPYMEDSKGIVNQKVSYVLRHLDKAYELELLLDKEWLSAKDTKYPVYIDPTITNTNQSSSLQDTYIFPGDTGIDRNSAPILKAGVEKVNGTNRVNRTLIKFDLPEIGTGSEIIGAYLTLTGYASYSGNKTGNKLVTMHRVTQDWNETSATWAQMNNKYDSRVESIYYGSRSDIDLDDNLNFVVYPTHGLYDGDITNLVKRWYKDTKNYGLLLKSAKEVYIDDDYPAFYSKNNNTPGDYNPMPLFQLVYRNQNGLENYLNYNTQSFTDGNTYINTYNGNMTAVFHLGSTIGGKLPTSVKLIYNTNDAVLNNTTIYGRGYKLNLDQTLEEVSIDNVDYIEYVDEDGTSHYFNKEEGDDLVKYHDEDGLNLTLEKNDNDYIMTDKVGNKKTFTKTGEVYRLIEMKDVSGNINTIQLDSNNRITKVIDANEKEINFTYDTNKITVTSPDISVELTYTNGILTSIKSINGTTNFTYNNNHLISSITDVTGIKINYEYYSESPYKMKKVTQYGLNNKLGNYFSLEYGCNTTSITDHKGKVSTLIFNNQGNLLSSNNLKSSEDISSAYSITQEYGEANYNKNKLLSNSIPTRYVKNYLSNTSFEQDNDNFTISEGITKSFSTEQVYSGNRSLKLESIATNQEVEQEITLAKGKYYTFSGYFKSDQPITLSLSYVDSNNNTVTSDQTIESSEDFIREDVTIYYDENATSNLKIKLNLSDATTLYMDNIQLEEGEVANCYNVIENSDFSQGLSDWNFESWGYDGESSPNASNFFEVVNINNNQNQALKVKMNPLYGTRFSKTFPIKGKQGDIYNISFWYKNEGFKSDGNIVGNSVMIYFKPVGSEADYCILPSEEFNPNPNIWQYFTFRYTAEQDYESIKLMFNQGREANNFYITNLTFYKDLANSNYIYDESGNITNVKDSFKDNSNMFGYDNNNQLINATNPKGKNFKFEYDNIKTDRVLSTISSYGISNQIQYDSFGNPVLTRMSKKSVNELGNGTYRIRSKGTNKYIKARSRALVVESDACSNTIWTLEKLEDKFKIIYSTLPNYSLSCLDNQVFLIYSDQNNLFNLEKNENGSYSIKVDNDIKYLKVNGNTLEATEFPGYSDPAYEFYFETTDEEFIENTATYTEDGRFVTSVTDSNFNTTTYQTNSVTGLTTSMTNANGVTTNYQYNDQKQITSVTTSNKSVSYSYNDKNLLSKITQGTKEYNFAYDDFLNTKKVMIGNNITLSTNDYEDNNGNLAKTTYGNNHEISFDYDDFERIKTIQKMDDTYHYKYDNNGNLAKILSNNHKIKYTYDIGERLHEYRYDNFRTNYEYDINDNIIKKQYRLDNISNTVENTFNSEDLLTKVTLDNKEINYQHDSLGRLISKTLGEEYQTTYKYISNGNRTYDLIEEIKNGSNKYSYKYDKLNNITEVYYNDELIKKYSYDVHNELIEEEDYEKDEKITYTYDNSGNLGTKVTRNLTTNAIIKTDTYQYGNSNWEDQLTSYNGTSITYDNIGNPLTIGNNISMSWINGRSLNSYTDTSKNLNITYKYDVNGIRTNKIINGIETEYFLNNNRIIYEKKGNNYIYYLYDTDELVGLKYNNNIYYYIKNLQGDIIGILNDNYEQIVSYEYDSWGKLLSTKDAIGNAISDTNHIGIINPFRYRGYYYDTETELYYLNSRYYNPEWRRFINADGLLGANQDIFGYNLYIYVSNNPIVFSDYSGDVALALTGVAASLGMIAGAIAVGAVGAALLLVGVGAVEGSINAYKNVKKAVKNTKKKSNNDVNNHNVYTLYDPLTQKIEYVGRTTDLPATKYRHRQNPYRRHLELDEIAMNVSKDTARGLEQMIIESCRTLNKDTNNPINNQINGVSPRNKKRDLYWDSAVIWSSEHVVPCR